MKKGTVLKKRGLALLLSFFLGFGALSCGIEMRALAEESGTSPETGGDSETTPLLEDTITLSSLTKELVYTGDSLSGEFSATAVSGRKPVFSFYKGKTVSGDPVTPIDAGDYTAVARLDADEKYEAAESSQMTFTIKKASIKSAVIGAITAVKYTGSAITPTPAVTFNGKTLTKDTDYTLSYENNTEPSAAAVVMVEGKGNFEDTALKFFTILSPDKIPQVFSEAFSDDVTVTYGDDFSGREATLITGDGAITYESSDTDVATVSATTGAVTIKNAGTVVIRAKAAETDSYAAATASYTLTVDKADIYVTALDRNVKQGERAPLLNYPAPDTDYIVEGLLGNDALRGEAFMRYQKNGADVNPDTSEPGTYAIVISGFLPPNSNYNDINFINGTLTVQRNSGTTGGIGTPIIYGESEIRGWDNVVSEIRRLIEENPVEELDGVTHVAAEIDMNGSTVVVKELIDAIRGEAIVVYLLYDNGTVWTIDGRDVDLYDKSKDLDLGLSLSDSPSSSIPVSVKNAFEGKAPTYMSINHDGTLGFGATLTVNVAKAKGESVTSRSISRLYGKVANLYYYNSSTGRVEFSNSDYINESGEADFKMTHASDYIIVVDEEKLGGKADVMRVYNPNTGRHHLTANRDEIDFLVSLGWRYEGIAFTASASGADSLAVYRLYNPYSSEHLFTLSAEEKAFLTSIGWRNEGICWYSDSKKTVPVFRFYNPNAGDHHFTMNQNEISRLVVAGWRNEGIAYYAEEGD